MFFFINEFAKVDSFIGGNYFEVLVPYKSLDVELLVDRLVILEEGHVLVFLWDYEQTTFLLVDKFIVFWGLFWSFVDFLGFLGGRRLFFGKSVKHGVILFTGVVEDVFGD